VTNNYHPYDRDTGNRRAAGIDFTVGVLDNSLVLVTTSAIGRSTDWWAFTYAFRYAMWTITRHISQRRC
jgi:hypothetical protein